MSRIAKYAGWSFYRLMQLAGWGLRVTPWIAKRAVAWLGARAWFYGVGFRRRVLLLNLAHAFPREKEESSDSFRRRTYALAVKNLENYFYGVFEVVEKTTWSYATLQRKIVFTGAEHIERATAGGRGAFLLAAHLGNWEIMLALAPLVKRSMSVIVRYVRNPFWDEVLRLSREAFPVNLLSEKSSGITAMRAYKKGELVVFVLDQHTGEPHGVLAQFFGLRAWTAKGLAILASRMQAPVIPAFSYRVNGRVHVTIEPPIDFSDLGECREPAQILEHVQRCNDRIESWVRQHPEQYFWVHRRLKGHLDYRTATLPYQ